MRLCLCAFVPVPVCLYACMPVYLYAYVPVSLPIPVAVLVIVAFVGDVTAGAVVGVSEPRCDHRRRCEYERARTLSGFN